MLVNPTFNLSEEQRNIWRECFGGDPEDRLHEDTPGMIAGCIQSFWFEEKIKEYNFFLDTAEHIAWFNDPEYHPDFGVCDEPEQVFEKWPHLATSEKKFFVTFWPHSREQQPSQGGWRWHKWGEYIGVREPQYEYLYDEPEIELVYSFHIYEIL